MSLVLDLFKAFDLVNHKLQLYNIETPCVSSYLQNRFQQSYFSGAMSDKWQWFADLPEYIEFESLSLIKSDKKDVISGVSQGSVHGPILVLDIYNIIYIYKWSVFITY